MANPLGWLADLISDFGKMFTSMAGDIFGNITSNQLKELLQDMGDSDTDEDLDITIRNLAPNSETMDFLQFLTFLGRYFKLSPGVSEMIKDLGNSYVYVRAADLKDTLSSMQQNLPYISEGLNDLVQELSTVVDEFPVTLQLLQSIMEQKWFTC